VPSQEAVELASAYRKAVGVDADDLRWIALPYTAQVWITNTTGTRTLKIPCSEGPIWTAQFALYSVKGIRRLISADFPSGFLETGVVGVKADTLRDSMGDTPATARSG
jgi:hypothetical protein